MSEVVAQLSVVSRREGRSGKKRTQCPVPVNLRVRHRVARCRYGTRSASPSSVSQSVSQSQKGKHKERDLPLPSGDDTHWAHVRPGQPKHHASARAAEWSPQQRQTDPVGDRAQTAQHHFDRACDHQRACAHACTHASMSSKCSAMSPAILRILTKANTKTTTTTTDKE